HSIVRWGLGPAAGLAALAGLALAAFLSMACLIRARFRPGAADWHARHLLLVLWALLNLVYFGGQFAKFMRYLLPAYPALAVLAGFFVKHGWDLTADRLPAFGTTARLARFVGPSLAA